MRVYVVINDIGVALAIFSTEEKANAYVEYMKPARCGVLLFTVDADAGRT